MPPSPFVCLQHDVVHLTLGPGELSAHGPRAAHVTHVAPMLAACILQGTWWLVLSPGSTDGSRSRQPVNISVIRHETTSACCRTCCVGTMHGCRTQCTVSSIAPKMSCLIVSLTGTCSHYVLPHITLRQSLKRWLCRACVPCCIVRTCVPPVVDSRRWVCVTMFRGAGIPAQKNQAVTKQDCHAT